MTRLGVPAAGGSGLLLGVVGAATGQFTLLGIGVMALAIAGLAHLQIRRGRPLPGPILVLVSTSLAAMAPFAGGGLGVSILPVLVILAFLGVFSTSRKSAIRIALWCAALSVWTVEWVYPELGWVDWTVIAAVLGGTALSAYYVFVWADDARVQQELGHRLLFEGSPIAIWELDYSATAKAFEELRGGGLEDLRALLSTDPEALRRLTSTVVVARVNPAAGRMGNASAGETLRDFVDRATPSQRRLAEDILVAAWEGREDLVLDVKRTPEDDGRRLDAVVHWRVPVVNGRPDHSRVIMTASDLTPVREAEERLAAVLASNQILATNEEAISLCSRALLLGGDERGVEVALETLCRSANANSAALLRRDEATGGNLGLVARSGREQEVELDSLGSEELKILASGRALDQSVNTGAARVARLVVPIFSGVRWMGAFWLESAGSRHWSQETVNLLSVAAPMFGAHWEKEDNRNRLEDLVASKDRFIATVSHELRTPLAAVVGFAELLKDNSHHFDRDELEGILETIASQSQDMAHMVEDLLVAARADIGTVMVRPQEVFLRAQVEVALAGIDSKRLEVVEVRGGPGRAWADPGRTRQIVRNLLTNAVRYGGSKVVIECHTEGATTVMTVNDNGDGLPEPEWERIFEPYHRAHDPGTQPASIGLGLTVSRQLARLMGGDLTYRAASAESVFELRLPADPPTDTV